MLQHVLLPWQVCYSTKATKRAGTVPLKIIIFGCHCDIVCVCVCVCVYAKVTVMNSIKVITKQCTVIKMCSTSGVQVGVLQK